MKKLIILVCFCVLILMLTGCKQKDNSLENPNPSNIPITDTVIPTKATEENTPTPEVTKADKTIDDYYPYKPDIKNIYEGEGNEYASFTTFVDFIDKNENKMQLRTNNGGTEIVQVIEKKDGVLSVVYSKEECYYRDNFIAEDRNSKRGNTEEDEQDKAEEENTEEDSALQEEILLMEPLEVGTKWNLSDGSERYISGMDVGVTTPAGSYEAIEVTTDYENSITKQYYAPDIGLVKQIFQSGDTEVTSSLSAQNTNSSFDQDITFYYPNEEEQMTSIQKTVSFFTNNITRLTIQEAMSENSNDGYIPLISTGTKINSMYLGDDNIAYIFDFSNDFVRDMNVGAGFEEMILQGITDTLGKYYGVKEVCLTVDGQPYESGHLQYRPGETLKVSVE